MIFKAAVIICIIVFVLGTMDGGFELGVYSVFKAGIISFLVILTLYAILSIFAETKEVVETEYEICSLEFEKEQHDHIDGTFFLGTGRITEKDVEKEIYYFITNEEKGKRVVSLDNKKYTIYIKEDDSQTPKVQKVYTEYDYSKNKWMTKLFGIKESRTSTDEIIIVVPTNTVKVDYNVSLN